MFLYQCLKLITIVGIKISFNFLSISRNIFHSNFKFKFFSKCELDLTEEIRCWIQAENTNKGYLFIFI